MGFARSALLVAPLVLAATFGFVTGAAGGTPDGASRGGPVVIGPYLQRLSSTSVEIRMEIGTMGRATVDVEGAPGTKRTWTSSPGTLHSFHVDGLNPETRYRYVVHAGAFQPPAGEFVTAPLDNSRDPFAFVVYGDTRTNDQAHAAVVAAIQQQSFDFLVNTGDFVAAGGERPLWREFFSIERDLLRDHCVFACVGNHELVEDEAATNFLAYFGPSEATTVPYGSFRWAGARFFLLNAFQDWGQGELAWLERELDKADSEPNLAWRIVVVHHAPWSSGRHGDDAKMIAAGVPELLVRHHVDLLLAGHDHIYERGEAKGLKYLISGGGGAPLYTEMTNEPSTRHFESTYHFVHVAVAGDKLEVVAKRLDGSMIESCGFQEGQSWDCDPKATPPVTESAAAPLATPQPDAKTSSSRCACRVPGVHGGDGEAPVMALVVLAIGVGRARRSRGRSSLRKVNDQHRERRGAKHPLGNATQESARDPAPAVGSKDDKPGPRLGSDGVNLVPGGAHPKERGDGDTQPLASLDLQLELLGRPLLDTGRDVGGRDEEAVREAIDRDLVGMHEGDPAAESLGKVDRFVERVVSEVAEIGRHDDVLQVHGGGIPRAGRSERGFR
jgi:acid phosphatase type 7